MKTLFIRTLILGISLITFTHLKTFAQKTATPIEVVGEMFDAFGKGDMESLKKTVSTHSVWIYQGPKDIPYTGTYNGKEGATQFIGNIFSNVEVQEFKVLKMIAEGNTVIVLGFEKQKVKKTGKILEQNWVQVYKVENGLISRMEEYADTYHAAAQFN